MKKITAIAPMRIDFAGGTIDLPPLYLYHHPAPTVNAAVNIKATVTITPADQLTIVSKDQGAEANWPTWHEIDWHERPMLELAARLAKSFEIPPVRVEISSDAPAGSGLGGSSVIAIALTAAFAELTGKKLAERELIEWAKSIETQTIKVPTGYQDYWGAVYGGVNAYQIELDGNLSIAALGTETFRRQLQDNLMIVYVGKPHFSGVNNWELFKQHIDNVNGVPVFFETLKDNGVAMQQAFESNDIDAVAAVLNEDWRVRKAMLPGMTTPEIEELTEKVFTAGAKALRVCGAGAGGCAILLVEPDNRDAVSNVVKGLGMQELDSTLVSEGVTVHVA